MVGGNYRTLNQGDVHDVLALADREGAQALAQEPHSIRVRLGLARLYREARFLDSAFLEQARVLLDEAKELAVLPSGFAGVVHGGASPGVT